MTKEKILLEVIKKDVPQGEDYCYCCCFEADGQCGAPGGGFCECDCGRKHYYEWGDFYKKYM